MITSTDKDKLLFLLCSQPYVETHINYSVDVIQSNTKLDSDNIFAILKYFERNGLISDLNPRNNIVFMTLHIEAHDLAEKGGFSVQDEIFKANIEKLQFEIENLRSKLEPDHLEYINKIATIGSAILGGLSLFPKS